jgi:hypothetical protein
MSYKEQLQQIYLRAPYSLDKKFGPYANIAARDAIPVEERYPGMPAYVLDIDGQGTELLYRLIGGLANSNWVAADSQGHVIQKDGSSFEQRAKLNFIGFPIVEDDPTNDATKVIFTYELLQTLTITDVNYADALVLNPYVNTIEIIFDAALTNDWQPANITGWVKGRKYGWFFVKNSANSIDLSVARTAGNVLFDDSNLDTFSVFDDTTLTQKRAYIEAVGWSSTIGQFGRMLITDEIYVEP